VSSSLIVASTRPCCSSATDCAQPSTASTFAPDSVASSFQLLVSDWAVVLPSRSSNDEIDVSPSFTTMTPRETVYGSLKRYCSSRSGVIDTWFAMTSNRPASRPAKIASHCVSSNAISRPSFSATASATSTS
jgi:hypothetical protein